MTGFEVVNVAHAINTRNRRNLSASVRNQGLIPSTQVSANNATIADVLTIVKETHDTQGYAKVRRTRRKGWGAARMRARGSDATRAKLGPLAGQSGKRG